MGVYDVIEVSCPECGTMVEFQSKSGGCTLTYYNLDNVPDSVLQDINRHSPYTCDNCNTRFSVCFDSCYKGIPVIEGE